MTGQIVAFMGDLLRGGELTNLTERMAFGHAAMWAAIDANPSVESFVITVNPFNRFMVQRMVDRETVKAKFTVHTDPSYAKDSWQIKPVG